MWTASQHKKGVSNKQTLKEEVKEAVKNDEIFAIRLLLRM